MDRRACQMYIHWPENKRPRARRVVLMVGLPDPDVGGFAPRGEVRRCHWSGRRHLILSYIAPHLEAVIFGKYAAAPSHDRFASRLLYGWIVA